MQGWIRHVYAHAAVRVNFFMEIQKRQGSVEELGLDLLMAFLLLLMQR